MKANTAALRSLVASSILIFAAIVGIYHGALEEKLISPDELTALSYVLTSSTPLLDFVSPVFGFASKYRPMASLWTWAVHQIFGLNYAGYQLLAILVLFLSAVLMLKLAYRLTASWWLALTIPLLFVTHPFISDQWNWPLDTGILNTAFAVFTAILLLGRFKRRSTYFVFFVLLVLSLFARETTLTVLGGIVLYALYGLFSQTVPRRTVGILLVGCVSSAALYLLMRVNALGLAAEKFRTAEDGGVLFTFYTAAQIAGFGRLKRLAYFAYNSTGHALSNIFPVLTPCGLLWWEPIAIGLMLAVVLSGLLFIFVLKYRDSGAKQNDASLTGRARLLLFSSVLVVAGVVLLVARVGFGVELLALANAVQIAISVGIVFMALKARGWSGQHKLLALFALGLVLSSAVIGYSYFRYRILHVSVVGWFILLLLSLAIPNPRIWQAALKIILIVLVLDLAAINAFRVHAALPFYGSVPTSSSIPGALCDPTIHAELAFAVAADAGIDLTQVENCRSSPRRSPPPPSINPPQETSDRVDAYSCGRTF